MDKNFEEQNTVENSQINQLSGYSKLGTNRLVMDKAFNFMFSELEEEICFYEKPFFFDKLTKMFIHKNVSNILHLFETLNRKIRHKFHELKNLDKLIDKRHKIQYQETILQTLKLAISEFDNNTSFYTV